MEYNNSIKIIKLTNEELLCLQPLHENISCPKKCHVGEKRIWFIPRKLVANLTEIDYSCCINCWVNKGNLSLLNGKYKREDLQPILSEDLDCNCDEGDNLDEAFELLHDNFKLGIYQNGSQFIKLDKVSNYEYNARVDNLKGSLSVVLYKNCNDIDMENILFAKIYNTDINQEDYDNLLASRFFKTYSQNNELCLSIKNITRIVNLKNYSKIDDVLIKYNFFNKQKYSFIIEYTLDEDLVNLNRITINIISNKNYKKMDFYEGIYENKNLII